MTVELGLNLAGVERVLDLEEKLERAQRKVDALERRKAQLEADIARLEAVRREVRAEIIPYREFAEALKPPSRRAAAD
jgi:MerR family transcriptional regulator, heat shock protein HspR